MSNQHASPARRRDGIHVVWEGFIVLLVVVNLTLILFDTLFAIGPLSDLLAFIAPSFHAFYANQVHPHFALIDLAFVAVFVLDVLLGWAVAVAERTYSRWYYYPFAHWYDVLGCIPLGGFRILRVLRVVSLMIRLQRLGLIDVRQWAVYRFVDRYWQMLLEELSDRVMVKMFSRLQQEIGSSDDLARRLIDDVVRPRKARVLSDLDRRLSAMVQQGYLGNRTAIEHYVSGLISTALADNNELRNLRRLPMGGRVADALDAALSDIVAKLLQSAVNGVGDQPFRRLAIQLTDEFFEAWLHEGDANDYALEELLVDIIEVLKQQIMDRRWSTFVGPPAPVHLD
ncbi:ion transporter [Pseudomonas sp. Marseille-QA0892]